MTGLHHTSTTTHAAAWFGPVTGLSLVFCPPRSLKYHLLRRFSNVRFFSDVPNGRIGGTETTWSLVLSWLSVCTLVICVTVTRGFPQYSDFFPEKPVSDDRILLEFENDIDMEVIFGIVMV